MDKSITDTGSSHWSIGFGIERIGILVLSRPRLFTVLLAIVSAILLSGVPQTHFDGNVTAVLPEETEAYKLFFEQKRDFRDFAKDVTIIIRSDRLNTAEGLEDLRFLQLEIAVTEGVASASSVFSIPIADPATGKFEPFFPEFLEDDANARRLVAQIIAEQPTARTLFAPDENIAVILATLEGEAGGGTLNDQVYRNLKLLQQEVALAAPDDFQISYAGLPPIGVTIVGALISDQLKLTLIGLALGTTIALFVFRSLVSALICTVPPAFTAVWVMGTFGLAGIHVNYLTTVLPTLALILAFADGIVLYFRWQSSMQDYDDPIAGLRAAILRVGPASALTSITTALAFYSFSFASSSALKDFAYLGVAGVALAFLAVITALPVVCYWAVKFKLLTRDKVRQPAFGGLGSHFHRFSLSAPLAIFCGAIVLVSALVYVHTLVRPEYKITDYLPHASDTREAERIANERFGGGSVLFLSVPVPAGQSYAGTEARARLAAATRELESRYGDGRVISLDRVWRQLQSQDAIAKVVETLENQESASIRRNFISKGGDKMLISVRMESDLPIQQVSAEVDAVDAALRAADIGDVQITGLPVLMSIEFTRLIDQLRTSLLIAILLGVCIIGIAARSFRLALAAITPNLLPIFVLELALYLRGGVINMSEVIALTIAFGIAIDNAVHVLNIFIAERRNGCSVGDAVAISCREVGPALCASTMIICVASLVTQISALPMVPILGQLIIATLLVALVANLAILPANILTIFRATGTPIAKA